jgi:hypothetical protein
VSRQVGESIAYECRKLGIAPESLEPIATNGVTGDDLISVYELGGALVADTNGDPVWEESDEWRDLPAELREQAEKNRSEPALLPEPIAASRPRLFRGDETAQLQYDGRKADPELWYWEPDDYEGDVLWSKGYGSRAEAYHAAGLSRES